MVDLMNAIAQVSAAPTTGPKLDNRRVLAAIVDLLIVGVGAAIVLAAGDSLSGDRQGALGIVILGWALYYYFALESGDGQTVGKKVMKLRVVRADGRPAGMGEIAVRTILRVVDGIGGYIVGLIVMLATGERRQRIGDLAAGTIVVDASGPATVAPPAAADGEADEDDEDDDVAPAAVTTEPARTITLPSRPEPPAPLSDLTEPAEPDADEPMAEVVEDEPVADVVEDEPVTEVVEDEPEADEPVATQHLTWAERAAVDEPVVEVEQPAVEEPVVEAESFEDEPVAEEASAVEFAPVPIADGPAEDLPHVMSPSLEGLAADVAAAQDSGQGDDEEPADEPSEDDGPVNVKSVETVSAMDLIMGAAEEDAAQQDDDEGPVSA
jgi:uncharacterized RDD family membrane protein YckC